MSDLRDLYQEVILDHTKRPRNFGPLGSATHRATGRNPLCGDQLVLMLDIKDDVVRDAHFAGKGCAISTASASLLTEAVKGKTTAEAHGLFELFHAAETPMRVKCASLAWHTLEAALAGASTPVSTE